MNCIIYTRFSPRPDAADSESCDFQREKCEEYANQKGWGIREAFDDPDRSGADEYREQLWQAVDALKKGDALLVYKRDRLARDVYLACQIERMVKKRGATIVAVSGDVEGDTPETRMVRVIVAAMSEYERMLIKRRTSDAMRSYQKKGRRMGRYAPYGYAIDPNDATHLIDNPAERAVIERCRELRNGGVTWAELTERLNQEGYRQRNGKPFQRGSLITVMLRALRT